MNLLTVLLQATAGQSSLTSFLPLILIVVVFYFFMIRPQMKKQKELRNFRESVKKGDKVITTGGIYGKVADIKDNHFLVEIAENVRVKFDKAAILKDSSDLAQAK